MSALVTSIGIIVGLGIIGAEVVLLLWGKVEREALLGLAYPLGAGLFTALIFLVSLVGTPLTRASILVLFFLVLGVLGALSIRSSSLIRLPAWGVRLSGRQAWVLVGAAIWFLLAVILAIGRAYSTYDAFAGWALKGYGIFFEGTIFAAAKWGTWGLAYPLNMPLQIGLHWLYGAESLPGSKLIFPTIMLSMALVCVSFFRWARVRPSIAMIGTAFIVTNPLIFLHGTIGFQNLPFGTYLVSGILISIRGFSDRKPNVVLLGGALFALAAWTRAEGVLFCAAGMLSILVAFWRHVDHRESWVRWVLPLIALSVVWFGFGWQGISDSHLGEAMRAVLPSLTHDRFNLSKLILVPGLFLLRAISPDNWGLFIPGLGLMVLVALYVNWRSWDPTSIALALASILVSAIPVGLFYVRSFSRMSDFKALLIRSFDRAFIPAAIILVVAWLTIATRERAALNGSVSRDPTASPQ